MTAIQTRRNPRLTDGVDQDLRFLIPEGICRTFRVMPYAAVDGTVLVAAADADDTITAHVVAERIDRPVLLVRHTVNEIVAAIDSVYPPQETEVETPEARRARMQMAQMLTRSGLITDDQLQRAMLEYSRTGDPLGDILVSHEAITEDVLVAALSEMYQMQRVGLAEFTPDLEVARRLPEPLAQAFQAVPVAATDDLVLLAVARPLDAEQAAEVEEALGSPFRQLLANRTELDQLIQRVHARHYAEVSTRLLMETRPEESAHIVVSGGQKAGLVMTMIVIVVCGVIWPMDTAIGIVAFCSLLYLVVSFYKFRLTLRALGTHLETDVTDEEIAALDERHLPMYTILVPLYKEAGDRAPPGARHQRAGLPADPPRREAALRGGRRGDRRQDPRDEPAAALPPRGRARTASRRPSRRRATTACSWPTGDFCVIFDAEDRPDPDQLKKAVIAFGRVANNVVCVQAKLNHFNQDQNLLTAWFANEYSMHFELMLPAMGAAESPIPLGGTSNHFITSKLRELGAWDPFNVTEDADLGIRLHREGYRTAMIDSTTLEEANSQVPNWIRQRSRWIKGYIQTWLVHMRHPFALLSQTGLRGFLSFNLTMGSAFVLLLNPIFWGLTTLYVLHPGRLHRAAVPGRRLLRRELAAVRRATSCSSTSASPAACSAASSA